MSLKFKKPFGPGFSKSGAAGRRFRELMREQRKQKKIFDKLRGKPKPKIGARV